MPSIVTVRLEASAPLFFDETWPLEELFLDILRRSQAPFPQLERDYRPYTLSPLWRTEPLHASTTDKHLPGRLASSYEWRIGLLDDALTPHLLQGIEAAETLKLEANELTVSEVASETCTYQSMAQESQDRVANAPDKHRRIRLEFLTPALLYRSKMPMPLPDPALVFRYYLGAWDTFAPRDLWANFNLLDGIKFHIAITDHRLETRRVRPTDRRSRVGCVGWVNYTAMAWRKLGPEFLGTLHTLARFAEFCGTGELTTRGLGQTRYMSGKR